MDLSLAHLVRALALACVFQLCRPRGAAAVKWTKLGCPNTTTEKGCSWTNPSSEVDAVVSLFFQVELAQGEPIGKFTCGSGKTTYCSRGWLPSEGGSSGSCWFLVPAGGSYACTGEGTVHFIGSNSAPLASKLLSAAGPSALPCLKGAVAAGATCEHTGGGGADEWLSLSWTLGAGAASTPLSSFSCSYASAGSAVEVCSYSANTSYVSSNASGTLLAERGSSCAFLLPAAAKLSCAVTAGGVSFDAATLHPLVKSVYGSSAAPLPANYSCPDPPTPMYPNRSSVNPCNCGWKNPHPDRDVVLAINALAANDGFSNFFCYAGVQQVCEAMSLIAVATRTSSLTRCLVAAGFVRGRLGQLERWRLILFHPGRGRDAGLRDAVRRARLAQRVGHCNGRLHLPRRARWRG